MAKIPVHFHDEEFFEVQAKKTQARIQALSSGALTRDPDAPTIKAPKPLPPAIQPGTECRERVSRWQKQVLNAMKTHNWTREQAMDHFRQRKADQRKAVAHGN